MSAPQNPPPPGRTGLGLAVLSLVIAAAVATALVAWTERETRADIAKNRALHAGRVVLEVLPAGAYDNKPALDAREFVEPEWLGTAKPLPVYPAMRDGKTVAHAVTVIAPNGYVGPIRLLVGIRADGRIHAVRALEHRETPGLGDRIEPDKSAWIRQFEGKRLEADQSDQSGATEASGAEGTFALRREGGDFDALSGATITSRAVVEAVENALRFHAARLAPPDAAERADGGADAPPAAGTGDEATDAAATADRTGD